MAFRNYILGLFVLLCGFLFYKCYTAEGYKPKQEEHQVVEYPDKICKVYFSKLYGADEPRRTECKKNK